MKTIYCFRPPPNVDWDTQKWDLKNIFTPRYHYCTNQNYLKFESSSTSGFVNFMFSDHDLHKLYSEFKPPFFIDEAATLRHFKEPPPILLYSRAIQPGTILIKNQLFRLQKQIHIAYEKQSTETIVIPPRSHEFCFQSICSIDFDYSLPALYHFKSDPIYTTHHITYLRFPNFIQEHLFPPIYTLSN